MRTLVLGLGNPILRDDGVGLHVVDALQPQLSNADHIVVDKDYWGGLRLMERMIGFDRAIIIDAICTSQQQPGTLMQLSVDSIPTQRSASAHDVNLPTALEFGRSAGAHLPDNENIHLIGIEAEDILTFDEGLSPAVKDAVPAAVDLVMTVLSKEIVKS
ncbi:MAG: hydrogenase maturation protease [Anaerolineales bacterium]|jgi:hydrogenase maturation protease